MHRPITMSAALVAVLAVLGCTPQDQQTAGDDAHAHANGAASGLAGIDQAVAVMHGTDGHDVSGTVRFEQRADGSVHIVADLAGLSPGKHAIHIHEFGDARAPDGTSAGGHYNPEGHQHGLPEAQGPRHAGDLGNLEAGQDGEAHYELTVDNITIAGSENPILGRSVIVHAKADTGGQPTGEAGGRVAIGVIGVANPQFEAQ